jgi:hypothetical protein
LRESVAFKDDVGLECFWVVVAMPPFPRAGTGFRFLEFAAIAFGKRMSRSRPGHFALIQSVGFRADFRSLNVRLSRSNENESRPLKVKP